MCIYLQKVGLCYKLFDIFPWILIDSHMCLVKILLLSLYFEIPRVFSFQLCFHLPLLWFGTRSERHGVVNAGSLDVWEKVQGGEGTSVRRRGECLADTGLRAGNSQGLIIT